MANPDANPGVDITLGMHWPGYVEASVTLAKSIAMGSNLTVSLKVTRTDKRPYPQFPLQKQWVRGETMVPFTSTHTFPAGAYRFRAVVKRSGADPLVVYSDVVYLP